MAWIWLALAIGLLVVEAMSVQLVCVWFSISALVTSLVTLAFENLGFGIPWQLILFAVLSVVLFVCTRKLVKRFLTRKSNAQKTNLELYIGKEGVVTEDIDNIKGQGAVKVGGLVWSAQSIDGNPIKKDEIVIFKEVNGNKAVVEPKKGE
ncbi:MAG: NfeD family protein [Clostridia bacterium]|nr:NfeD family protein [Clostridia bacterium]